MNSPQSIRASKEKLLATLRNLRACTVAALAAILATSEQMVRRWLRTPQVRRQIRIRACLTRRGRPVQLVSLRGCKWRFPEHERQVSTFYAQLLRACRDIPGLHVTNLRCVETGGIRPDLAFLIESEVHNKSLLFFLELDCASEPIARATPGTDVATKFQRYAQLRVNGSYSSMVPENSAIGAGFRVLVVTPNEQRAAAILRAASDGVGGDFVWVTDWSQIERVSIVGNAWLCGDGSKRRSIFGTVPQAKAN